MTKRMLIDATHAEETRVAVVDGNRLVEFDYESKFRKPLKGSIFLAKVTRVEPSLQAAFVNFGGNRHGFLPFSEIHPDYFRIPISDREALIAEQEELLREAEEEAEKEEDEAAEESPEAAEEDQDDHDDLDEVEEIGGNTGPAGDEDPEEEEKTAKAGKQKKDARGKKSGDNADKDDSAKAEETASAENDAAEEDGEDSAENENSEESSHDGDRDHNRRRGRRGGRGRYNKRGDRGGRRAAHRSRQVEILGGTEYEDDDSNNAAERARFAWRRKYKIQEVIKRGQIMLIQVSREERGNKGAAVSTYLSLPGRYGVLMPNSPRAGGVSRKIANQKDRARLRDMLREFETPKGMSVILRTAGVSRTKTEIKRDVDYLMRLWGDIRELTLNSSAPALIYEEADLMKRAVRDLYTREVEEILVSGKDGYEAAKKFMKMMIPSHAKRIKEYAENIPLFHKYQVESQISEISEPTARLKSGGYLVINPTEALVSIDVNSGRATKERHIEETALNTNLEAAEEVARQLRLRDLGGLVVVDFIDMEDRRNNARVERKLKEALSTDRARIQIGRISSFGLLEMSRQRLNPSLTEAQFELCKACNGVGHIRTPDATCIMLLRAIEDEGIKQRAAEIIVHVSNNAALYLLNNKRTHMDEIEARYNLKALIRVDDSLGADKFRIEVSKPAEGHDPSDEHPEEPAEKTREQDNHRSSSSSSHESGKEGSRRRGRRGGRGRGRGREQNRDEGAQNSIFQDDENSTPVDKQPDAPSQAENKKSEPESKSAAAAVKEDTKAAEKNQKADQDEKPKSRAKTARTKKMTEDEAQDSAESGSDKKSKDPSKKKETGKSAPAKKNTDEKPKEDVPVKKAQQPSNDTKPAPLTSKEEKPYETVNEAPDKPKKGWWNRLMD